MYGGLFFCPYIRFFFCRKLGITKSLEGVMNAFFLDLSNGHLLLKRDRNLRKDKIEMLVGETSIDYFFS